jgi:hypothetical protein
MVNQLDLNLLKLTNGQVLQQCHTFEEYNRNGSPTTEVLIFKGESPYEQPPDMNLWMDQITQRCQQLSVDDHSRPNTVYNTENMDDMEYDDLSLVSTSPKSNPFPVLEPRKVVIRIKLDGLPGITATLMDNVTIAQLIEQVKSSG